MPRLTQKAALEEARSIIDRYPLDVPFDIVDLARMSDLASTELYLAMRRRNPMFPDDVRHLHVIAYDWQEPQQWSWREAIKVATARNTDEAKASRERGRILRALRRAIVPEVLAYRRDTPNQECAHCGSPHSLTTDHLAPPFIRIALDYLEARPVPELREVAGMGGVLASADVEADWLNFHANRATYQLLCRSCNSAKGAHGC